MPPHLDTNWTYLAWGFFHLLFCLGATAFILRVGLDQIARSIGSGARTFDIWGQLKQRNMAVALLIVGVLLAYANVLGPSLGAVSGALVAVLRQSGWRANAGMILGGGVNLGAALALGTLAIILVIRVLVRCIPGLDARAELAGDNVPLGAVFCGALLGVSWLMSSGMSNICGAAGELVAQAIRGHS